MDIFNSTNTIGVVFSAITTNITGHDYLTLILLTLVIMGFFAIFRLPIELTAIFILPMMLVFMAFSAEYVAVGMLVLIYVGVLFAKRFFLN